MVFEVGYMYRDQFGDEVNVKEEFEAWGEEGKYTLLYEKRGGQVSVVVPTKNVHIMKRISEDKSQVKPALKIMSIVEE